MILTSKISPLIKLIPTDKPTNKMNFTLDTYWYWESSLKIISRLSWIAAEKIFYYTSNRKTEGQADGKAYIRKDRQTDGHSNYRGGEGVGLTAPFFTYLFIWCQHIHSNLANLCLCFYHLLFLGKNSFFVRWTPIKSLWIYFKKDDNIRKSRSQQIRWLDKRTIWLTQWKRLLINRLT